MAKKMADYKGKYTAQQVEDWQAQQEKKKKREVEEQIRREEKRTKQKEEEDNKKKKQEGTHQTAWKAGVTHGMHVAAEAEEEKDQDRIKILREMMQNKPEAYTALMKEHEENIALANELLNTTNNRDYMERALKAKQGEQQSNIVKKEI
jgi:hypothetical protein